MSTTGAAFCPCRVTGKHRQCHNKNEKQTIHHLKDYHKIPSELEVNPPFSTLAHPEVDLLDTLFSR
jgi:hypothetical protein